MDFYGRVRLSPAVFLLLATSWGLSALGKSNDKDPSKCDVCRHLVEGFEKQLKRTARLNFAGGDVAWEEERKLSYATSETRFLEILEEVCTAGGDSELTRNCEMMLEDQEELVETWWFKHRDEDKDLMAWLCISKMKECCTENRYGTDCKPCPGGVDTPCGGAGTCTGAGDRKGSGKCVCNAGYAGHSCGECSTAYIDVDNSSALTCKSCHRSCALNCSGIGPGDCDDCKSGWLEDDDVCKDIDECAEQSPPCQETGKYCSNTEGSYRCASCHRACADNCTGGNAASCRECASGYERSSISLPCVDTNECAVNESLCSMGEYCKNTAGSFLCLLCHVACSDGCSGAGPDHCTSCAAGYDLHNSTCEDVNECESNPCNSDTETCLNVAGSFSCDCQKGFKRVEGQCQELPKKPGMKYSSSDDEDDDEDVGTKATAADYKNTAEKDEL